MARTKQKKAIAISSELGAGDFAVSYNSRTGRPIRKAQKADSPFVDSAVAISDEESSEDEALLTLTSRSRKRKRSPSPPLSDQDDDSPALTNYDGESDVDEIEVRPRKRLATPAMPTAPVTSQGLQFVLKNLVVNVPLGHIGPVVLQLSPDVAVTTPMAPLEAVKIPVQPKGRKSSRKQTKNAQKTQAGFLDLPAELRNEIYRLVFVTNGRLNFGAPTNFGRSAAFLRTCRQVHEESRSILYGENDFYFNRRTSRYGSFWEDEWRELGFRSIRKFLKTVGTTNTALIRHLSFQMEDATPCLNPDSMSHSERRFVHDDALMSVLRHLGDHAQLQTLKLSFHGRRRVETSDDRFLAYMKRIKADTVEVVKFPIGRPDSVWSQESKQEETVRKMLLKVMVRKQKLYE